MPKTVAGSHQCAAKAAKLLKAHASFACKNLEALKTIWPLPNDPDLATALDTLTTRMEAALSSIYDVEVLAADLSEAFIAKHPALRRRGYQYTLRRGGSMTNIRVE